MSAQASLQCGAAVGERSGERVNSRNGHRHRPWDARLGTSDLAVPKLRRGSLFVDRCPRAAGTRGRPGGQLSSVTATAANAEGCREIVTLHERRVSQDPGPRRRLSGRSPPGHRRRLRVRRWIATASTTNPGSTVRAGASVREVVSGTSMVL